MESQSLAGVKFNDQLKIEPKKPLTGDVALNLRN
jgi:hypothetical protein